MLGTADCLTGTGTCSAVVRTTDGGASFDGIPGPPVGPGAVSQLRFASALDGYAFGPGLWQTTTGGSSWTDVSVPGQVSELEAAGGEAYLLTTGPTGATSPSVELLTAPVGSSQWHVVATPGPLGFGARFVLSGSDLYLLAGNGDRALFVSVDQGGQFSQQSNPCTAGLGGTLAAAVDGSGALWAVCPTGTMAAVLRSSDGGQQWTTAMTAGGFPNSLELAAATATVAVVAPPPEALTGALARTVNGGNSYAVVLPGTTPALVTWIGFSDPSRAYAIVSGTLEMSLDGGTSWRPVAFRR
jgi:photosystem II stability/assembly factor-like uncharacterized protein